MAISMRWWQELGTVGKWILGTSLPATVVGIVSAWHWLTGKWDALVLGFFEDRERTARRRGMNVVPMNASVAEIGNVVHRGQKSILRSLLRLERQKKVVEYKTGWSLYPSEIRRANSSRFKSRFEG